MTARKKNPNPARQHEWHARDGKFYPLRDLPHGRSFIKMPTPQDIACAAPQDPEACALAACASREAGGIPAMVGADKAYIPMLDEDGRLVVWRCRVPAKTRRAIYYFDATGEFPPGGFVFTGIPPSQTLDSQRSKEKRRRERWGSIRGASGEGEARKALALRNATRRAQGLRR